MIVIIISPGKIISTLLASRTRRFISKLSTSLVIFNLTQTWTYYYDPGFPFSAHKERSLQSRGAKYLRTRETHRGWKIEAIAAHDSIPLLPPPFHSYPPLFVERNERILAVRRDSKHPLGTLGSIHPSSHASNDPKVDAPDLHFNIVAREGKRNTRMRARSEMAREDCWKAEYKVIRSKLVSLDLNNIFMGEMNFHGRVESSNGDIKKRLEIAFPSSPSFATIQLTNK